MKRKGRIEQELEETLVAYRQLLVEIPDEALKFPSNNPAWTIGEVLYHMSLAPRMLTTDLRMIIDDRWYYRLIPAVLPKGLFDWLNKVYTRYGARNASHKILHREYSKAHLTVMNALESVSEEELDKSVRYPDWDPLLAGEVTVERLFHYVKIHFDVHAEQIRAVMADGRPPTTDR